MKVFYHGIKENNGGLENFAKNLIQEVLNQDKNIEYTLFVESEDFSYRDVFEKLGCNTVILPNSRKHPFKFYKQLYKYLKSNKDDNTVGQLNICSYRNYFLFKAFKKAKIKTIIVGHYTKIEGKFGFLHYLNKKMFKSFGLKVTMSNQVTEFMFNKTDKTYFLDNGIPCDRFNYSPADRKEIRNKLGFDDKYFVFGQIGRISPEKNQLFSIQAFELFKKRNNTLSKLVFVGKEMSVEPREYASKSEYKNDIIFLGPVYEGVEKYYSAFDCCLMPSIHEAMPLSELECSSNGVKSIFSDALPKLKVDCPNVAFLPLDINKWSNAMVEVISSKANDRVNYLKDSVYDIRVCAKSYIDIYYNYDSIINNVNKDNK